MNELLIPLGILLIIFVALNLRYVFKLRAAKVRLEREVARYAAAAADLDQARKTEITNARAAVHHLMGRVSFLEDDARRRDRVAVAKWN